MIELGGRNHRCQGLALSAVKHTQLTGHVFAPHPNPGLILTFPPNPTQSQIAQVKTTYKEQLHSCHK